MALVAAPPRRRSTGTQGGLPLRNLLPGNHFIRIWDYKLIGTKWRVSLLFFAALSTAAYSVAIPQDYAGHIDSEIMGYLFTNNF